ncbi:MAG: cohesin domain-containing protein, partial [Saprospiraceae bacterium]
INLTCANLGVNVVIFAATDINGNTSTFATAVTVFDVTLPAFTNPWTMAQSNIGVLCPAAPPPATDFPQTAADQCDNAVSIVLTQTTSQTMTGCGKYSYIINRTWTATDDSGNAVTRTQHIVVQDSQVPVFAANTPATVTASTTPNSLTCTAQVTFDMAGFVSDCEAAADVTITNALISAPPGNTFVIPAGSNIGAGNYPLGTYVIRFTAKDACGNMATKDLTVVVSDATPPTAVCINGVSASLQPSGSVVVMVNQFNNFSYDNCGGALDLKIQRLDQNPLVAPSGNLTYTCADADGVTQHPVKLFVADAAGNMSMCLTYIVIQDNVAPVLTCPVAVTVDCAADKTPTALGSPTIVDNCAPGAATFTDVITAGVGTVCEVLTRTWKVIDQANNMGTCNQIINIKDTQAPTFTTTPANLAISCEDPLVVAPVLTATDNCSVGSQIVITFSEVSSQTMVGCTKYNYTTTRTWHATDKCGNTATHTQMVVVTDTKKPVFLGMPDTLEVHAASFPTIQDVCLVSVTFNAANFLVECAALNELTINSIVFQPAILPSITPTLLNVSGNYPIGSTRVIFTLTDPCGNQGKDTVVVKVIDDAVPSMACDDFTLVLGSNGEATITPNNVIQGNDGVFDNCGIDTLILSKTNFDCSNLGLNAVTLTATDNNGNENFCTVDVNVTLGNNTGFNLSATGTSESYFGADNGTGTAVATGGTGVFTYLWSGSGATTAAVNGLSAGVHTVSVSDSNSGCIAVDTVVVQAGPKVTITVGTGNGCQGATVTIPVTADNFINVSGFSFGLALSNGLVGAITSLSDVNPALVGLTPGANSVFWTHPMLTPTTLPNGTLLFNVNIQLANPPTAVGTTSGIVLSAIPALVFLQDGTNPAPLVTFNPGTVTISCPVNDLQIAGEVFTWKAPPKPVPGVTITLTGTANGTDVTALPTADYSLFVPSGANAVVTPSKSELLIKDQVAVNIGDAIRIQSHVAVETSFDNPYQWVAADINGDQKVNLVDFALIKAFVLGTSIHFPPVAAVVPPDWKFVPKVHVFMALPPGNPAAPALNPLNNPAPPSTIAHNNIVASFLDDDFVAVRNGDVTGSVNPQFSNDGGGAESVEVFKFRLDERTVQAGETVTIPFKSVDFVNAQAYQMTIAFDPEVFELQDILPGVLPGLSQGDFGTSNLADGLISTLWIGGKPMSLNDNETLFSLTFKALENVSNLSNVLHSSSDITEALAIGQGGDSMPIDFEFVSSVATGEVESKAFALYQNQPNPFTAETNISFRLPEAGRATLRVFSAEGRVVKMVVGEFAEGINSITFRKDELGSNGVFYYELETPKFSDRKKMILID